MYKLKASNELVQFIRALHPDLKRKIRKSLETITEDPESGKELKEELAGLRSFRLNRHRIIYRISGSKTIELIAIGPRKNIYEETLRKISQSVKSPDRLHQKSTAYTKRISP